MIILIILILLIAVLALIGRQFSKQLSGKGRKWWRLLHFAFAIIYFSGVLGVLLLVITATKTNNIELIYAAHLFSKYCDWFMIIPGAFGSLLTGTWISVRTNWGLLNYYWVIVKVAGNLGAILYGSTYMREWFNETIALSSPGQINPLLNVLYTHNREMLIMGTIISLLILTLLLIISVYKPWGKRELSQVFRPSPSQ
ncbi:MAG: DUF2269 domain-containing protein [Syntrophomonadaceae bacterium]|nr:DUF2269 domain-containing protein [Syntrophomonadaceae bacterium]MDD3024088.1 DUF2269 domain-containing protein [Syntrophomonadaceae bacterium]